jgi:hypothetical protein
MADPPSAPAVKLIVADPSPAVAVKLVGAAGMVACCWEDSGVIEFDATEDCPVPAEFVAVTVKV